MPILAKDNSQQFDPVPQGVHPARCFQVLDLGTQKRVWNGEEKARHELRLVFELLGKDKRDDEKPFTIAKTFTLSLAENSALRPFLESWRGKPFTAEELDGFDISKLIGAYGSINVLHEKKNDKTYANIAAIMPLPKAQQPDAVNPNVVFSWDPFDQEVFDALHKKTQEVVQEAWEWKVMHGKDGEEDINDVGASAPGEDEPVIEDIGDDPINLDDIPF